MQNINQYLKRTFMLVALLVMSATASAQPKELVFAGTIEINATQFAFILSGKSGGGVLEFQGKEYKFDLTGFGIGGIGVQTINAVGAVYNMTDLSQFNGVYTEARIGATLGTASSGASRLGNSNGVIIDVKASNEGVALSLGVDGVSITLK